MNKNRELRSQLVIDTRFLANISFSYPDKYKVVSNFFGFTFTKNSYKYFLKGNFLRGFNNSFNFFLCPWEKKSIKDYIEILNFGQEKEFFFVDALIINGRLLNIYTDRNKQYLYEAIKRTNLSLYTFEYYLSLFLFSFLNYTIKIVMFQLNIIMKIKRSNGF